MQADQAGAEFEQGFAEMRRRLSAATGAGAAATGSAGRQRSIGRRRCGGDGAAAGAPWTGATAAGGGASALRGMT